MADFRPVGQHAPPTAANPSQPPAAAAASGKRRGGRPRGSKNKPKPSVHIAQEICTTRHIQLAITDGCELTGTNPSQPPAAAPFSGKRRGGRPRGSKNKPKPPVHIAQEISTTRHIQLLISDGCEIIGTLESYARRQHVGIHVVGGFGTVANVTLRKPAGIFPGASYLRALAGTYVDPSMYTGSVEGTCPSDATDPWLTMFMTGDSGSKGNIITRGAAVSAAQAFADVVVNIITFKTFETQRVDPAVIALPEQAGPSSAPTFVLTDGGGGDSVEMGGEMPAAGSGCPDGGRRNSVPWLGVSFKPPKPEP